VARVGMRGVVVAHMAVEHRAVKDLAIGE
jgi:hypothetical protein